MFIELEIDHFPQIADLFASLDHSLSIAAVLEGISSGWVYCDRPSKPQSAFMGTMEGYFLAGDPGNSAFNSGVCHRIERMLDGDTVRPDTQYLEFETTSPDWTAQFQSLFQGYEPLTYFTRYYRCNSLAIPDWRNAVPPGFHFQFIDEDHYCFFHQLARISLHLLLFSILIKHHVSMS